MSRTECYVDTSALIAFLDRSDISHPLFRRLFSKPPALVTSALVIAEGHGRFLRRYGQRRGVEFLAFIDVLPRMTIVPFSSDQLPATRAVVNKFIDQKLTLADAHGLSIMKQRKTSHCWSTDRHMSLTGVALVASGDYLT